MPYKPGLGQGHNQKKDTHTLDFDVAPLLGLKQLTSLIFHFAKDFLAQNVLMTAQRHFRLGNSLLIVQNQPHSLNP
jgi:hypothetical protein